MPSASAASFFYRLAIGLHIGQPTVHAAATKLGLESLNLIVWAKTNAGMGSLRKVTPRT
jgi:hypothetical protein